MSEVAAVTGGRDYGVPKFWMDPREVCLSSHDRGRVIDTLNAFAPSALVVGDALGADNWARAWASKTLTPCDIFYANWKKYGKSAGPRRNREMLDAKPDYLLSFRGGKGTHDCTMEAIRRGIPVFFPDNIHFEGTK